jgi:hypothetical protein
VLTAKVRGPASSKLADESPMASRHSGHGVSRLNSSQWQRCPASAGIGRSASLP